MFLGLPENYYLKLRHNKLHQFNAICMLTLCGSILSSGKTRAIALFHGLEEWSEANLGPRHDGLKQVRQILETKE